MTNQEKALLRIIALMLQSPRNRFGKIQTDQFLQATFRKQAEKLSLFDKLPHGGVDAADQAAMVLMALIGDKVKPMDWT